MSRIRKCHEDYTIGWICALSVERTAAEASLDETHEDLIKPINDTNHYTLGSIGRHNVVITCLPKSQPGNSQAASTSNSIFRTFTSIKVGLMVGVGGGIPPKVRLGDVVVGCPQGIHPGVIQYDLGKEEKDGFKRTGCLNNPPTMLLSVLQTLESKQELGKSKIPEYMELYKETWKGLRESIQFLEDPLDAPIPENWLFWLFSLIWFDWIGWLIGRNVWKKPVVQSPQRQKPVRDVRIHYGLIATGNRVIKKKRERDRIDKSEDGSVLCFEMEAGGLISFPCLVIRGICDYADEGKNNDWQRYAAAAAAAYAKELLNYLQPEEVHMATPLRYLEKNLENISTDVAIVRTNVAAVRSKVERDEDIKILNWLTPTDYSQKQEMVSYHRQKGTGQWLLDSEEFQYWLQTENHVDARKRTLFCPGMPGAGKTYLTSIVVDHLIATSPDDEANVGIAYIYFEFKQKDEQKIGSAEASLLKQLSQGCSVLPEALKNLYDRHSIKGKWPSVTEYVRAIKAVCRLYSKVFIVIDALDECQNFHDSQDSDKYRQLFLANLLDVHESCNTRVFITSRDIPDITSLFHDSPKLEIRAHDDDVRKYIETQISNTPCYEITRCPEEVKDEIKEGITKSVQGMFLLARLHFETIERKETLSEIRSALKNLPQGIDAYTKAYDEVMIRINSQTASAKVLAYHMLLWVTYTKRYLTVSELQHAFAIQIDTSKLDKENLPGVKRMISVCEGLIALETDDVVRFVHYTIQEYLQEKSQRWFPNPHLDITRKCVTYLSYDIFKTGPSANVEAYNARLRENALYEYAASKWGYHAYDCSAGDDSLVLRFLQHDLAVRSCEQTKAPPFLSRVSDFSMEKGVHLAARFGLSQSLMHILNSDTLEAKSEHGLTPLQIAVGHGHYAAAKFLIENKANLEADGGDGTPLCSAAVNGDLALVELLVESHANLEAQDDDKATPLHGAASTGKLDVVKLLVARRADLEAKDEEGVTPLSIAARKGYKDIVKTLIASTAKLEARNDINSTPLCEAARFGRKAVAKLLVDAGAYKEAREEDGATPLCIAARHGHKSVVELLIDSGADLKAKNDNDLTPLCEAIRSGKTTVVKLLIERDADIAVRQKIDGSLLLDAIDNRCEEGVIQVLIDEGANVHATYDDGKTPLTLAAGRGDLYIVRMLIAARVKLEKTNGEGRTPLIEAIIGGHLPTVKLLIESGANTDFEPSNERLPWSPETLLHVAARQGYEGLEILFREHGMDHKPKDAEDWIRPPGMAIRRMRRRAEKRLKAKR